MAEWQQWKHVFKLDPDRSITDEAIGRLCRSGTDAIMIGGSSGVTQANTMELLSKVRPYGLPCVLEVSSAEAIVPGFDLYMIPVVLNARDPQFIVGKHLEAIKRYSSFIPWDRLVVEGYVVLNADSEVARLTDADTNLTPEDVLAYVDLADKLFSLPILYIEYSGTFGDLELVARIANRLTQTRLFYGGGIDNVDKAANAHRASHTIVVGNAIYENFERALETVGAGTGTFFTKEGK